MAILSYMDIRRITQSAFGHVLLVALSFSTEGSGFWPFHNWSTIQFWICRQRSKVLLIWAMYGFPHDTGKIYLSSEGFWSDSELCLAAPYFMTIPQFKTMQNWMKHSKKLCDIFTNTATPLRTTDKRFIYFSFFLTKYASMLCVDLCKCLGFQRKVSPLVTVEYRSSRKL